MSPPEKDEDHMVEWRSGCPISSGLDLLGDKWAQTHLSEVHPTIHDDAPIR